MKKPIKCTKCGLTYDAAKSGICPYCGHPSPLEEILTAAVEHSSRWGGKRKGAGAPRGNLNRLKHGRQSKLIKKAVEKLAADEELRAFLLFIARAATEGEIPETTRKLLQHALEDQEHKTRRAVRRVSR